MKDELRRRLGWLLTTDFDDHEPVPTGSVVVLIIVLTIILIWGGLK